MQNTAFQIIVPEYSASVEEWRRAQAVPPSDLPALTDEQKAVARKFNITDEEYARNVLAGAFGRERVRQRAQQLGEAVQAMLEQLGAGGRVISISRDVDRLGWIVKVETPREDVSVFVSQELADDLLDGGGQVERQRLRARVVASLGLGE